MFEWPFKSLPLTTNCHADYIKECDSFIVNVLSNERFDWKNCKLSSLSIHSMSESTILLCFHFHDVLSSNSLCNFVDNRLQVLNDFMNTWKMFSLI